MKTLLGTFLRPQIDPEKWATRHGILPLNTPCLACGETKVTDIPIASGRMRGLAAAPCVCGDDSLTYCVVSVDGNIEDELLKMAQLEIE